MDMPTYTGDGEMRMMTSHQGICRVIFPLEIAFQLLLSLCMCVFASYFNVVLSHLYGLKIIIVSCLG